MEYYKIDNTDVYECYSRLVGPNFECLLTEPEDRIWYRDLAPVVERLNELENKTRELEKQLAAAILGNDIDIDKCNELLKDYAKREGLV